jgi:hypothetical protein
MRGAQQRAEHADLNKVWLTEPDRGHDGASVVDRASFPWKGPSDADPGQPIHHAASYSKRVRDYSFGRDGSAAPS